MHIQVLYPKIFAGYMKQNIAAGKQTYGRVINIASIYGLVVNQTPSKLF